MPSGECQAPGKRQCGDAGPGGCDAVLMVHLRSKWPDRQVAYAAALGRDRAAARLFSGQRGRPPGKKMWSSYGGSWREVTIGDNRSCLGSLGMIVTIVLPREPRHDRDHSAVGAGPGHDRGGPAQLRNPEAGTAPCAGRRCRRRPDRFHQVPEQACIRGVRRPLLEAWTETVSDENSSSEVPYLAIDDGVRDRAWVFEVSRQQYAVGIPGTVVHALVDPRRGALLEIRPLVADTPD
jgi:hypothetical protein